MILSIIIVSYNTKELLEQCLESITGSFQNQVQSPKLKVKSLNGQPLSLSDLEIIIVDNNSTDGTQEYLGKLKTHPPKLTTRLPGTIRTRLVERDRRVAEGKSPKLKVKTILNKENAGFARANNQGIEKSEGEYVLFLNPDTIVYHNTLNKTIEYLAGNPGVGLVTCRVELADGSLQKECHRGFPTPWRALCHFSGLGKIFPKSRLFAGYFLGHLPKNTIHEIDACVGAFMMTKKEIGEKIGWWDEDFFWYGEDLDLCYRIKGVGYKVIFYPKVKITHYQGASSGIKKTKSRANKETKRKVMIASVEAMRVFYQKHYQNKYPKAISLLVMGGIALLEKIRLWSVERQFK
jgi:GT2 family glycosyltransferase